MILFLVFALMPLVFALPQGDKNEIRYTNIITEGPYMNYSAQPLVNLGDGYYYFETNVMSNWAAAKAFCRNLGLFLVSVETSEENELLKNYIKDVTGPRRYWTSGNDIANKNFYVWDSTGKPVTFFDWADGEPNDEFGVNEQIIEFDPYQNLQWNDAPADFTEVFALCEQL